MIKRITLGHYKLAFTFARIAKVIGVNSELDDGRHILMWDFDDVSLADVKRALSVVQARYMLSDILILESKKDTRFLAYCFTAMDLQRTAEIITQTEFVDWSFIRFGIFREKWTLRVTPKGDRHIRKVATLEGLELPNCTPADLHSWVRYETLSWR